ncbi:MAG: hypothetical protein GY940_25495, partial [bacterium]|nr:hypothetical protein [bacterium]
KPGIDRLKEYLSRSLPQYMIPTYFVQLDRMPLTPNGKVDRKALPRPDVTTAANYTEPRDGIERQLVDIWKQVLNRDSPIGIEDDFFDIGGHSLLVLKLINGIHKTFRVKISFRDIYRSPTISSLAGIIGKRDKTLHSIIQPQPEKDYYELSYAQERLWLLYQLDPRDPGFNMPERVTLHEPVAERIIRTVFEALIHRHESFRTCFRELDGRPVQILRPGCR